MGALGADTIVPGSTPCILVYGYVYALRDPRTKEIRYVGSSRDPHGRWLRHHEDARRHHRLRTLGRTRHHLHPAYRRMTFLHRALFQWLFDLQADGIRAELLILDTCPAGSDPARDLRVMESCCIRDYARLTRLFNGNCPITVPGFKTVGMLYDIPDHQKSISFLRQQEGLTHAEMRWWRAVNRGQDASMHNERARNGPRQIDDATRQRFWRYWSERQRVAREMSARLPG